MIDKLAADNSGSPYNPGSDVINPGGGMDYFPTNTPGAGGIGADRTNKGGKFNDAIKIDTSQVTTSDAPPPPNTTKSTMNDFGQPNYDGKPIYDGPLGGGGTFGDPATNQDLAGSAAPIPGAIPLNKAVTTPAPAQQPATSPATKSGKKSYAENLAMIDKLADWTKYDDDVDPAVEAYGKNKPPSTNVPQPPKDWAKRKPAGDPGKRGGTWTPPTIPRKKK